MLELRLTDADGRALTADIETYYSQPGSFAFGGGTSALNCQAEYVDDPHPAGAECERLTAPAHANMSCVSVDSSSDPAAASTLSTAIELSYPQVQARNYDAIRWDLTAITHGTLSSVAQNGTHRDSAIQGETFASRLGADGSASFDWSASLGGTDRIEMSGVDASGEMTAIVTIAGHPAHMSCQLSF